MFLICYLRDIYESINDYGQAIICQKKRINTIRNSQYKNSDNATDLDLLAKYYCLKEKENNLSVAVDLLDLDFINENDSSTYYNIYFFIADYDTDINNANKYLNRIISYINKKNSSIDDSLLIKGLSTIGRLYDKLHDINNSIKYNKEALHKAEKLYGLHSLEYINIVLIYKLIILKMKYMGKQIVYPKFL